MNPNGSEDVLDKAKRDLGNRLLRYDPLDPKNKVLRVQNISLWRCLKEKTHRLAWINPETNRQDFVLPIISSSLKM